MDEYLAKPLHKKPLLTMLQEWVVTPEGLRDVAVETRLLNGRASAS
jgi:hypothetical protein